MKPEELLSFDRRVTHPLARSLDEFQGYDREVLIANAERLGLSIEEAQSFYFILINQLTAARPDGIAASVIKEYTARVRGHLDAEWEASGQQTTKEEHTDAEGNYTPERTALHKRIVSRSVDKLRFRGKKEKVWYIIAGPTGGGKSTMRNYFLGNRGEALLTDPDDIRESLLPDEEMTTVNTRRTHDEAGDISDQLFMAGLEHELRIISETTLRSRSWVEKGLFWAKQAGYKVELLYLHTQYPFCFGNSLVRSDRPIPPDTLMSCTQGIENLFALGSHPFINEGYIAATSKPGVVPLHQLEENPALDADLTRHIRQFGRLLR